jgi:hypothetical protein
LDEFENVIVQFPVHGVLSPLVVQRLEPDESGKDIALGVVPARTDLRPGFRLADTPADGWAEDVYSFGFPYSLGTRGALASWEYELDSRFVKGYVNNRSKSKLVVGANGPQAMVQLDMPCPAGLSGAPLCRGGTLEIVGVVQGRSSTRRGNEEDVFGWAVDLVELERASGAATEGTPLRHFLDSGGWPARPA